LILYVLDLKNLHNETISRNNLYEISRNKVQRNFTEFREISRNLNHFRRYFVFREIKKSYFATTLIRIHNLGVVKHSEIEMYVIFNISR
jgi:hypothetical protein